MKSVYSLIISITIYLLLFTACKGDCPEDTVINYPFYTEHRIFTNYKVGDSICFVSENLDTAKLILIKIDTFVEREFSTIDLDCGTDKITNTSKLRCFWKGDSELLNEFRIATFQSSGFPTNKIECFGKMYDYGMVGAYQPFPYYPAKYYDSLLIGSNYYSGIKYEVPLVVLLFNSKEGILKINYLGAIWKRIY